MNGTSPSAGRASIHRRPWLVIAASVTALGLLTAVAVDSREPGPAAAGTTTDDALYRQLENEGRIPRPAADDELELMRRLANEGLIPSASLE